MELINTQLTIFYWLGIAVFFSFGLIIGSFLNCVIWRFYSNESVSRGRSYCPKCRHQLSWIDLIPLFGFFLVGGKCRYCRKPISIQYPIVETITGLFFVITAIHFAPEILRGNFLGFSILRLVFYWTALASLIVIFVTDLKWYLIPDKAVLTGLFAAFSLQILHFLENKKLFHSFDIGIMTNPILTAIITALFFLTIFLASRGKWIGFGDVKYGLFMGMILGFPNILVGLFLANFFGAILGLGLIFLGKKKMSSEIPYGPFLVSGTIATLFFSEAIMNYYLSMSFGL